MNIYNLNKRKGQTDHTIFDNNYGIYYIKHNDKILYIGYTTNSFLHRPQLHRSKMNNGGSVRLYSIIKQLIYEGENVYLEPIFTNIDFPKYTTDD